MLDLLKWIFDDLMRFLGVLVLLIVCALCLEGVIAAVRR